MNVTWNKKNTHNARYDTEAKAMKKTDSILSRSIHTMGVEYLLFVCRCFIYLLQYLRITISVMCSFHCYFFTVWGRFFLFSSSSFHWLFEMYNLFWNILEFPIVLAFSSTFYSIVSKLLVTNNFVLMFLISQFSLRELLLSS